MFEIIMAEDFPKLMTDITTDPESSHSTIKQHKHTYTHTLSDRMNEYKTSLRHGIFKLQKSKTKKIS